MKKISCFLVIVLTFCSCIDYEDALSKSLKEHSKSNFGEYLDKMPDKTQVGANTFGCYINGTLAAARGVYQKIGGWLSIVDGFWDKDLKIMYISASLNKPLEGKIILQFNNLKEGSNICRISYSFSKEEEIANPNLYEYEGHTDTAFVNVMKWDKMDQIVCGDFDSIPITLKNSANDSIRIVVTRGQFDIKYGTN